AAAGIAQRPRRGAERPDAFGHRRRRRRIRDGRGRPGALAQRATRQGRHRGTVRHIGDVGGPGDSDVFARQTVRTASQKLRRTRWGLMAATGPAATYTLRRAGTEPQGTEPQRPKRKKTYDLRR